MNKKVLSLFVACFLFGLNVFATRNTVITSTLSNQVVCDPNTTFTIYGPNNGTARWQITFDTTQTPGEIFEYTSGISVNQSDSVVYYRRLSFDYVDTSNWYMVRYVIKPTVTNLTSYSICSGGNTQLALSASSPSSFTYTVVSTIAGATGASSGSGSIINHTLLNPNNNNNAGIVYRVLPTSIQGACVGLAKDITVNVLPKPQVTNISTTSVCSGSTLNLPLTASIPSSFNWTVKSVSGGITGSKDSSGINMLLKLFNPSNTTNGTVVYSVQAISNVGNCSGNPLDLSVSIKALPIITVNNSDTICSGLVNQQLFFQNSIYSNIVWTPIQSQDVDGAQSGNGFVMRQSLINNSTSKYGFVDYRVDLTTVNGNCSNNNLPLKVYVAPTPKIVGLTSKLICNGSNTNLIPTTDYPGVFYWTLGANSGNISGASASLQSKPGIFQTLTNSGTSTGSQEYLVRHVLADAVCASEEKVITVSVSTTVNALSIKDSLFYACSGKAMSDSIRSTPQAWFYWMPIFNNQIGGALSDSGMVLKQSLFLQNTKYAIQEFQVWPYVGADRCRANPFIIKLQLDTLPNAVFTYSLTNDTFRFTPADTGLISCFWNFGDGFFSNQIKPSHVYANAGKYTVTLQTSNAFGCSIDSALEINYLPVGLNENAAIGKMVLYPNPAQNLLYIKSESGVQTIKIQIRDVLGRICLVRDVQPGQAIDVTPIINGFYTLSIQTETQHQTLTLLIKR